MSGCIDAEGRHDEAAGVDAEATTEEVRSLPRDLQPRAAPERLNNETQASLYQRSSVMFPRTLAPFVYPRGFETRRVSTSGDISWHKDRVFISQVFSFEDLGFKEMDEDIFRMYFREIELGKLDITELRFRPVRALP